MPGAYSTQGDVIDASLSMIRGLNLTQTVTSKTPVAVPVFDGPPGGAHIPQVFIAIAGQHPQDGPNGTEEWAYIGDAGRYEKYNLTGHIYCLVGGDDNLGQSGPSDAQQAARRAVSGLMKQIEAGYLADVSLSNQNAGQQLVIWAYVRNAKLTQTSANDPDIEKGRWAQIDFVVNVYNTLTIPSFV